MARRHGPHVFNRYFNGSHRAPSSSYGVVVVVGSGSNGVVVIVVSVAAAAAAVMMELLFVRVCVCVCVFIKLHITAQPGLVKLIFQCYSNGSALWGISG